jgi:uncharacterized protein
METKSITFDLKAAKGKRQIEGYASRYERDLVGDVIQKGAFSKTIAERLPKNQIKILWQHDQTKPIGKPIHMEEDSKGLYIVGAISDTPLGNEALTLIDDGVVDTMSIGYDVIKDEQTKDGQSRLLKELRLYEFSPVTFPANPFAGITAVRKSIDEVMSEFNSERLTMLLKEGRVLSKANISAIENAINSLNEVLKIAGAQPEAGAGNKSHSSDDIEEPDKLFTSLLKEMSDYSASLRKNQ